MLIRTAHYALCKFIPPYKSCSQAIGSFLHRKVTRHLPESLVNTADKIIYMMEFALPYIIAIAISLAASLAVQLPILALAGWLIPSALFTAHEMIQNADLYPYDYLENMSLHFRKKQIPESNPRPDLLRQIQHYLSHPQKNNVLIVGKAGSGKTTLVNSLVESIENQKCSPNLKGRNVLKLRIDKLNAGAKMGKFEARFLTIMSELVAHAKDNVLFIDEIHQLIDENGRTSLSNLLKPFLEKNLSCIGATTVQEYWRLVEYDPGLSRRFHVIWMPDLKQEERVPTLQKKFAGKNISEEAFKHAIEVALRIYEDRALPDSAIDLIENTLAYMKNTGIDSGNTPLTEEHIDNAVVELGLERTSQIRKGSKKENTIQMLTRSISSAILERLPQYPLRSN